MSAVEATALVEAGGLDGGRTQVGREQQDVAGRAVGAVPCNFTHSGADRSLGSLNRPARMFDAVRATVSQVFHSDARSKRRADHEQGIGVPYPSPASASSRAEAGAG